MLNSSNYLMNEEFNGNKFEIPNNFSSIKDSNGYEAKIICDSMNKYKSRLTTITATYPRFVHSELMTHREFSRNAASSRAIPISKVIEQVQNNPAMPYKWQKNKSGMQGGEELINPELKWVNGQWTEASKKAINYSQELQRLECHKQICNRLLEPFVWMTTVISSTNWNNFFHLRCSDMADPTIRHIAEMIRFVIENNEPDKLDNDHWHLPFITNSSDAGCLTDEYTTEQLQKISVARCARVSYLNHEKKFDPLGDLELATRLEQSGHWSAFEHVAVPCYFMTNHDSHKNGNFHESWIQYRKTFAGEYVK